MDINDEHSDTILKITLCQIFFIFCMILGFLTISHQIIFLLILHDFNLNFLLIGILLIIAGFVIKKIILNIIKKDI